MTSSGRNFRRAAHRAVAAVGVIAGIAACLGASSVFADVSVPQQNLSFGSRGEAVLHLQKFLNERGYALAEAGPGSPGNETVFFGPRTRAALEASAAPSIPPPPPPAPVLDFYTRASTIDDVCPGGKPAQPNDPLNVTFCADRNKPPKPLATPTSSIAVTSTTPQSPTSTVSASSTTPTTTLICIFFSSAAADQPISFSALGGSGSYVWVAPDGIPSSGSGTSFEATFPSVGAKTVTVQSGGRSSVCNVNVGPGAPPTALRPLPQSNVVRVLSPNGNERLIIDKEYLIKYIVPRGTQRINIGVRKLSISSSDKNISYIAQNIQPVFDSEGNGSLAWKPSMSLRTGPGAEGLGLAEKDYSIFVERIDDFIVDHSDAAFSVVLQPVTPDLVLASPMGAQQWALNELHELKWCSNDSSLDGAGVLKLNLIDSTGRWVKELLSRPLTLLPRCPAGSSFFWKTGSMNPGRYQVEARYIIVKNNQEQLAGLARSDGITLLQSPAP